MTGCPPAGVGLREIEELYRRRYATFLRFALALVGDHELAKEAVQEAFTRAVRRRFELREEGRLDAWVYRTLANHCRDLLRESARRSPVFEVAAQNGAGPEGAAVRAAVAALPERQRLVLFLRHYADLDYETIAAALGIRRGTVAATLNAAHRSLKRSVQEELPKEEIR
jgi:RNA polymerase sigma-70 factor (ECF subfamily)